MRVLFGVILIVALACTSFAQSEGANPSSFTYAGPEEGAVQARGGSSGQQSAAPNVLPYDQRTDPRLFDPAYIPRVFQLKYVEAFWIEQLLFPFGALVQRQTNLNSIAVRAPSAVMDQIVALVKQMDVPGNTSKTIELTCYLILASPQAIAGEVIPPVLKPVIDQLRNVLTYKSYSVLDTIIGRTSSGKSINLSGSAGKVSDSAPWPDKYELTVYPSINGDGTDQIIRMDQMRFTATVNSMRSDSNYPPSDIRSMNNTPVTISTSLDLKKGQQVVVGKSSVREHALILVSSAKIE